jgi:hypothetical protein
MKKHILISALLLSVMALCAYSFMGVSLSNIKSINGVAIASIKKIANIEISPAEPETVADPVFDPEGCGLAKPASVTVSCSTDGATIYYEKTSGQPFASTPSDPTSESTEYTGAIQLIITGGQTQFKIKAIAIKSGVTSNIIMETYLVDDEPMPLPPE